MPSLLNNLGRRDEARVIQLVLKAELEAAGEDDPYVTEELELLASEGGETPRNA